MAFESSIGFIYPDAVRGSVSGTTAGAEKRVNGRIKVTNPATLENFAETECTPEESIGQIVEAARTAQRAWVALSLKERKDILLKVQESVLESREEIVRTINGETGKPRLEAIGTDIMAAMSVGDYCLDAMEDNFSEKRVDYGRLGVSFRFLGRRSYIVPRPLGVIGIIAPWNYPFGIPYSQAIMAVAAGNAVVMKPSSYTPMTAIKVRELFDKAGAPVGLVNIVCGPGSTVGEALVSSGVDRIVFTGSTETGREVMATASMTLTPVTLELGGKDPMVVLQDADLDRAVKGAVWGSFVNAGQTCACVKRIYVHKSLEKRFSEAMVHRTRGLRIGNGLDDPDVSMGPLISSQAVEEMERVVAKAIEQGAKLLTGGKRPAGLKGHFFEPTIFGGVTQDMEVCRKEIFGPIVAIIPFDEEEQALKYAWDNPLALTASIWSSDLARGKVLAKKMPGGTVIVNNSVYTYGLGATPWGGSKDSGFGRTHGELGFQELMEQQHVHIDDGRYPQDLWWSPYDKERLESVELMLTGLFKGRPAQPALKLRGLLKLMKRRD